MSTNIRLVRLRGKIPIGQGVKTVKHVDKKLTWKEYSFMRLGMEWLVIVKIWKHFMQQERVEFTPFFAFHERKAFKFLGPGHTTVGEWFSLYINFILVSVTSAWCKVSHVRGRAVVYVVILVLVSKAMACRQLATTERWCLMVLRVMALMRDPRDNWYRAR